MFSPCAHSSYASRHVFFRDVIKVRVPARSFGALRSATPQHRYVHATTRVVVFVVFKVIIKNHNTSVKGCACKGCVLMIVKHWKRHFHFRKKYIYYKTKRISVRLTAGRMFMLSINAFFSACIIYNEVATDYSNVW